MGKNTDVVRRICSGLPDMAVVGLLNVVGKHNIRRGCLIIGVIIVSITLAGCATPPPQTHKANYKSDFAARLDVAVNYHLESDGGIVVVDLYNPRSSVIRLWLVQSSVTDGQSIVASRRFYEGKKKKHQEVFRTPLPLKGITEAFFVEVFDINGKLILKSEPITHSPQEGQP